MRDQSPGDDVNSSGSEKKIAAIKSAIDDGRFIAALQMIYDTASPEDDFPTLLRYCNLCKRIPSQAKNLMKVKLALLGTSTLNHFTEILGFWLVREGFELDLFQSDFNTIDQTILDEKSELYALRPEIVWLFTNYRDVHLDVKPGAPRDSLAPALENAVNEFKKRWQMILDRLPCMVVQNNADFPPYRIFGNYESSVVWGHRSLLSQFNSELTKSIIPGTVLFDLEYLSAVCGLPAWHDLRYWYHSKHAFSINCTGIVASAAARMISAFRGKAKKCLVLDLDNTLWGGVVADDGVDGIRLGSGETEGEAYADFQKYLLCLKQRGILLTVCSKNEKETAMEPFAKHPGMHLKLDDFTLFIANWNNKADTIREIAKTLTIGLDSIVFVDDNPAERQLVTTELPEVSVVNLPSDPAEYTRALDKSLYFETVSYTPEDGMRNEIYKQNALRNELRGNCADIDAYLGTLQMVATVGALDGFKVPRAAQLINKSNQFHLTTTRYSESDLQFFIRDPDRCCLYFTLADRFGDNGLISVVILKKLGDETLFIDTWVMSCRVLSRGMEEFICNELMEKTKAQGRSILCGRYIQTPKNKLVASLYQRLGFSMSADDRESGEWHLDVGNAKKFPVHIERREREAGHDG
jgi:FkbH-like protein